MKKVVAESAVWAISALSLLLMVVGIGLTASYMLTTGDVRQLLSHQALVPFSTVAYVLVGFLVARKHPRNVVGWIFVVVGLLHGLNAAGVGTAAYGALLGSPTSGWTLISTWLNRWSWIPGIFLPTAFVFLYFPDGSLPSRRWLPVAWAGILGLAGILAGVMFHPGDLPDWGISGANPLGLPSLAPALDLAVRVGTPLAVIALVGSIAALVVRFRSSTGIQRAQMKWLVYASAWMVVAFIAGSLLWYVVPDSSAAEELSIVVTSLAILLIAVAAAIAILRHRLYDIDLVINRTLVYFTLSVSVVVAYILLVGYLGQLFQARGGLGLSLLATGIVAVMAHPLRERLQRGVNRLMYGERDDPYAVLSSLAQRLEATIAPGEVLPAIVESIAQALKLPYAAIQLGAGHGWRLAAEYGRPVEPLTVMPLTYQGDTIGRLLCAPRGPGEEFSIAERALLADVAHQAGLAVHAVQLTADLQRSRERLVTAREEERRRLRRDLHDGLGPELASVMLKLDAARNLLGGDPDGTEQLLVELKQQVQGALADIRRLIYDLRPPALDELGLVKAVRQVASSIGSGGDLAVRVEGPESLPPLPAAVEVAAYRIATEALTNVARHARASTCWVKFTLDDEELLLQINDDGVGIDPQAPRGVGMFSMRERAAELGGSVRVEARQGRGTGVLARLPLVGAES